MTARNRPSRQRVIYKLASRGYICDRRRPAARTSGEADAVMDRIKKQLLGTMPA
jgi:hypothetical protein